jgi:hypothetical protein
MRVLSIAEVEQGLRAALAEAQRQSVLIRADATPDADAVAALVSVADYEALRQMKLQKLDEFCAKNAQYAAEQGLTDEIFEELMRDIS